MTGLLDQRALWIAVASFVLWGLMPLYWHLLKAVPSLQIVLHRVLWSAVLVCGWLFVSRGRGWLKRTLAQPRAAWMLALSGVLIGLNWGLYIWAVNAGHVVESSLGYFINPLLNVVMGTVLFREKLTRVQTLSVVLAALGVAWLTWRFGRLPWIALALAVSFALYGLIRKLLAVDSIVGLGAESAYLFLPVLALLVWTEAHGQGGFIGAWWPWQDLLLVFSGALTALPLIGFAYALRRVPLSTVGLLQYIAPTLQLLIGVLMFGESFGADRAVGFCFIWAGLVLFVGEGLLRARRAVPVVI